MGVLGKTVKGISLGCTLTLVLTVPTAADAAMSSQQRTTDEVLSALMSGQDPALRAIEPSTSSTSWLAGPPFDVPADALVVNSPGTDDTTLYKRIDPMRGDLRTVNVVYPESLWPIISGKSGHLLPIFAPTYDQSVAVAVDHNIDSMAGLGDASDKPYVVYVGYSQGADALGDSAARAHSDDLIDPATDEIVVMSDPRSPWGLMQFAADHPLVGLLFRSVGAEPDGARDPAASGDEIRVTSVMIDGDPAANFQWVWYRPLTSLVVNAAGFLSVHSTLGSQSYADLGEIDDVDTLYSRDGRTTYLIYHARHPLTQVTEMALSIVGIHLSDTQVERLNTFSEWFYPLQQPNPERAAPAAPVTINPPASSPAEVGPLATLTPAAAVEAPDFVAVPDGQDASAAAVVTDDGLTEEAEVDADAGVSVEGAGADGVGVDGGADGVGVDGGANGVGVDESTNDEGTNDEGTNDEAADGEGEDTDGIGVDTSPDDTSADAGREVADGEGEGGMGLDGRGVDGGEGVDSDDGGAAAEPVADSGSVHDDEPVGAEGVQRGGTSVHQRAARSATSDPDAAAA